MTTPNPKGMKLIMRAELLGVLDEFEAQLVQQGTVPDARKIATHRYRLLIELFGAVAAGSFVAVGSVLCNFILFTTILHM